MRTTAGKSSRCVGTLHRTLWQNDIWTEFYSPVRSVTTRSFLNKRLNMLEMRLRRARLLSRPVYLHVEPTLRCNSFCVMCNRAAVRKGEDRNTGFLSWSTLASLGPFVPWAEQVLFGGFGEPLLHPEYVSMLAHIKSMGPEVYFFTNGILLTPDRARGLIDAGADRICVSFGGATPETYRKVRGVEMAPVVENLRELDRIKWQRRTKRPKIALNVVAMNSVIPEMEAVVRLAASLGVEEIDMPPLSVQNPELEPESPWPAPEIARPFLDRAAAEARRLGVVFRPPDFTPRQTRCRQLFDSLFVAWDGQVLNCPMERFIVGDLSEEGVEKIWNRPEFVALRAQALEQGSEGVCPNCFCWDSRAETYLKPHRNARAFATDIRKPA